MADPNVWGVGGGAVGKPNSFVLTYKSVADPEFPVGGGVDLVGGGEHRLPSRLFFENFVCRNERIWTLGGVRWVRPLNPPMQTYLKRRFIGSSGWSHSPSCEIPCIFPVLTIYPKCMQGIGLVYRTMMLSSGNTTVAQV